MAAAGLKQGQSAANETNNGDEVDGESPEKGAGDSQGDEEGGEDEQDESLS